MDCDTIRTIVVDQSGGGGGFRTIQETIDSIQENNDQWVKVQINAGKYAEKVVIPQSKGWVYLEGAGKDVTTITHDEKRTQDWNATFTSYSPNVIASGITFENTYNLHGGNPPEGDNQALAAAIYGDKCAFHKCGFVGFQDTLFDATGVHYFKECYIQGETDFIFGYGQSYYEDCTINVTKGKASVGPGYVTAQGRKSADETSGFVFKGGNIDGTGQTYLGRAWGPFSRVIFYETAFGSLVTPDGWFAWHAIGQEQNLFYAEVNCTGPGNDSSHRIQWEKKLTVGDMDAEYSIPTFINKDGWLQKLPTCFLSSTTIEMKQEEKKSQSLLSPLSSKL